MVEEPIKDIRYIEMCKSLSKISGVSPKIVEDLLRLMILSVMQNTLNDIVDRDKINVFNLDVPMIGRIYIDNNKNKEFNIVGGLLDEEFTNMLSDMIVNKNSPLIDYLESKLVDEVNKRYNSLLDSNMRNTIEDGIDEYGYE